MLGALLANLRTPSYPARERKHPAWWLAQYPAEVVAEKKRLAKELKAAVERLRFMQIDGPAKAQATAVVAPYVKDGKPDYLEMALDKMTRDDLTALLQMADDEEFFLWF